VAFVILTILALVNAAVAKRKDDIVVLRNGDRMTGETKELRRGTPVWMLSVVWTFFRFNKTDLRSRLIVFPSLSTPSCVRLQANTNLRFKIASDLWWGFHIYENYDGKPPLPTKKNDLGVSTSIGWTF
jgi:hypothetical protein